MVFTTAYNPVAQLLAGIKGVIGSADSPCREGDATQETIQSSLSKADFVLRDKVTHWERVAIVTDPTLSKESLKHFSKLHGINGASVFAPLTAHDPTKCCVQDLMHVMLEGGLPLEVQLFLRYVRGENLIKLTELNHLMKSLNFGHLQTDCLSEIVDDRLNNTLRQNSLHLAVGYVFPFLSKPFVKHHPRALQRLNNLVTSNINLALHFTIQVDDVALLERMIIMHHPCFKRLYPDKKLPPKFHYMIHFS